MKRGERVMDDTATSMRSTSANIGAKLATAAGRLVSRLQVRARWAHLDRLSQTGQFSVGRHTYGLPTVYVSHPEDTVTIGSFCSLGPGLVLIPGGNHPLDSVSTFPLRRRLGVESVDTSVRRRGPIHVGHDVWMGTDVTVLSGVTIGTGAVIAAGALVTQDVEPYTIVAGVPAKAVRPRVPRDVAEALLRSEWWERSDDDLLAVAHLLESDDYQGFLAAISD